ncbi:hypothetical protein UlMin_038651 [Ulmus minor]
MLLRSVLELSSRRAGRRIPLQVSTQIPTFLRKELSTKAENNASPQPNAAGKPQGSGSSATKVVLGAAVVGAAVMAAYRTGYLDQFIGGKEQRDSLKAAKDGFENHSVLPDNKETNQVASAAEKVETPSDIPNVEASSEKESGIHSQVQDKSATDAEEDIPIQKKVPEYSQSSTVIDDQSPNSGVPSERSLDKKSTEENIGKGTHEELRTSPISTQTSVDEEENELKAAPSLNVTSEEREQDAQVKDAEPPSSLLEAYNLRDKADESIETSLHGQSSNDLNFAKEKEAFTNALEDLNDGYITKDGKLVLDFLQAIHTAEQRQAELDAHLYAEEKRALKGKYEKELKDAAVRELMLAEEAAMLDKELKRERAKAAAALKSLQEKLEEKHKTELEQKESEAEFKLKKVEELAKAELAAKIASEKAAQIEKISEANLHINALCMAFYARSEEARWSHSAHKLALGALAIEDALSRGLPIQSEIEALHNYLEGIDKESVLDLVLSSLPDETRNKGADTLLQLNQKFNDLKGTLRHFSLIPPGGGGILAHSLAHVASWLKVKEADQSGDGIESVINKVEFYLAEGKLAEAAEALEEGVKDTRASEIVNDWVRQARNRAITEQALTLLQSYATSISLT